jgi:hypothetical protein
MRQLSPAACLFCIAVIVFGNYGVFLLPKGR